MRERDDKQISAEESKYKHVKSTKKRMISEKERRGQRGQ